MTTAIVYSVPRASVTRTGGKFNPPVHASFSMVVKKEPTSPGAPYSPSCWEDFIEPEDALQKHEHSVKKELVYTPKYSSPVGSASAIEVGTVSPAIASTSAMIPTSAHE